MANCELLDGCAFFNDRMADQPVTADLMKSRLCKIDNAECARYKVYRALGEEKVPPNLFPNQLDKASRIIEAA